MARQLPPLVAPGPELSREEIQTYARHLLLPHLGADGQRRLRAARVAVVGAGGLGSPALLYLAAAGVGTLGIIDDDVVEPSNLQRQIIHRADAVGLSKARSAARTLAVTSPLVRSTVHEVRLTSDNAAEVLGQYDLVLDGTDNFPTRYLVNDTCDALGKPFVWASLMRTQAQVSTFWRDPLDGQPGVDLRDVFPHPPADGSVPACGDAGVLGVLCGQVGALMANEAIKLITGTGITLLGRVLMVDSLSSQQTEIPIAPRPRASATPSGGHGPSGTAGTVGTAGPSASSASTVASVSEATEVHASRPATPVVWDGAVPVFDEVTPRHLAAELHSGDANGTTPVVLDVREPGEVAIAAIDGSVRIPVDRVEAGEYPEIPRDARLVVHCKTGPRATRAAVALQEAGFTDVSLLMGGMLAWIEQIEPEKPTY